MQFLVVLVALVVFALLIWLAIQVQQGTEGWFVALFRRKHRK